MQQDGKVIRLSDIVICIFSKEQETKFEKKYLFKINQKH